MKKSSKYKIILTICLVLMFVVAAAFDMHFKLNIESVAVPEKEESKKEEPKKEEPETKKNGSRTIMVYIIGSDLESMYSEASLDITEMLDADIEDDVNVLLYLGGARSWDLEEVDSSENAIFEVKEDEIEKVKSYDRTLMTEASTLTTFLDYVYDHYESDVYDLILWDHGGGPIFGYGIDEFNEDVSMELDTLSNALEDSELIKNQKLEFIGFDACLMGSVEVAHSLKDYADYLIASEEVEPGMGWNYKFLEEIDEETTSEELGKTIVDTFFDQYKYYIYDVNLTLSVVDLSEIDSLVSSIDELFKNITDEINIESFSTYSQKLTRTTVYGDTGRDVDSYDLVDLYDLVTSVQGDYPVEVKNIINSFENVVIYNRDNMENTNGLSIYFPTNNKLYVNQLLTLYKDVSISKTYSSFLTKYVSFINGQKLVDKSLYKDLEPVYTSNEVSVELPDNLVSNYQYASYTIFRKIADNKYIPLYKSGDVTLNNNVLSAKTTNAQMIVTDKNGEEPGWVTMYEVERTDEYAIYAIPAIIDRYVDGYEIQNVNILYKIKKGETTGEIVDVRTSGTSEVAPKSGIDLNEWQSIQFFNAAYKLFDESGNYIFESYQDYYLSLLDIADGFELKLVDLDYDMSGVEFIEQNGENMDLILDEYYYLFTVVDTQGEQHRLNLVEVK